jgi:hypothetical protein
MGTVQSLVPHPDVIGEQQARAVPVEALQMNRNTIGWAIESLSRSARSH